MFSQSQEKLTSINRMKADFDNAYSQQIANLECKLAAGNLESYDEMRINNEVRELQEKQQRMRHVEEMCG